MNAVEPIQLGGLTIRYLIDGSATGTMGVFELTVQPGSMVPPPHSHGLNEEVVHVLEGTLQYAVGDDRRDLVAGESMHTPKGVVHAFSNPFAEVARALIVLSPDIGAQYFRDVGGVLKNGPPLDKAALVAVMGRYGLTPGLPAPAGAGR